jgi:hypothetical protein
MIAQNAAVFNHLLALLLQRGSIRDDFGIAGQLRLWHFLWGQAPDNLGLAGSLDEESLAAVTGIFAEAHTGPARCTVCSGSSMRRRGRCYVVGASDAAGST